VKPILKAGDIEAPATLGARHQASYDWLAKLSGAEFDRAFVSDIASSYSNDTLMLQRASMMAKDDSLKTWASKALPGAQAREQSAKDLMQTLTATK
jgi:putative membrane protein